MSKLLLVDTNFSAFPIYRALECAGHEVHVVGNNPGDCLAKIASRYWHMDYSDTTALSSLINREKFEYLVPGCTDRSYSSCVAVGQGRFPGFDRREVFDRLNHKANFRRCASQIGLPVPGLQQYGLQSMRFPAIVKPVDAFSGRGITVLKSRDDLETERAIQLACSESASGDYLVEDFVAGQLYSHSAFLSNKHIVADFLVREDASAYPYAVDTSCVLDNASPSPIVSAVRCHIEALADHLDLTNGLFHTQFVSNGTQLWLIEVTRRCPGDLYSSLIEISTGFPYAHWYIAPFINEMANPAPTSRRRNVLRHTITTEHDQIFRSLQFLRCTHIEQYVAVRSVGDHLKAGPSGRLAVIFLEERDENSFRELYDATLRRKLYVISG